MKKLILLLLLVSCTTPKKPYVWKEEEEKDTFYMSDYDKYIINKIYNAERMCDIFPSDTMDEGPSYDEYFKRGTWCNWLHAYNFELKILEF